MPLDWKWTIKLVQATTSWRGFCLMKVHSPRACRYHFWKTSRIISLLITKLAEGVVGKGLVAVKKLSNTFAIHETKFHEEVACLMMAKHKNIVRFLGYCSDTQGKMEKYKGNLVMADQRNCLLCFEYVCNGSLDKHITGASCGLNWRKRYQIIRGICEGLVFLHKTKIIHLDLKPANIFARWSHGTQNC